MIRTAEKADSALLAGLALRLWPDNTLTGLKAEFASDCELTNDESLRFHLVAGFEEANRIICFKKRI